MEATSFDPETCSKVILMVGNSLTTANDMPRMLAKMLDVEVMCVARGGARLAEFSNLKTGTGARVLEAFDERRFDFVVMQDMSHLAASNPEAHRRAVEKMCALARQNGAVPVVYGTWAYREGNPRIERLGMGGAAEMARRMSEGSLSAARECDALCVDTASMVERLEDGAWFYAADGIHPSEKGSHLVATAIAQKIRDYVRS